MGEQNTDESIDLDLFVGSKDSYRKMAEKSHKVVKDDEPDNPTDKQSLDKKNPNRVILSKDTLTQIDEETLTILRRTRCVHETEDVYMQASLEFYDEYYNDVDASPELKKARQIRRVYRRYSDYLEATRIRTEYIDSLIDKYGEDTFIQKMQLGMIKDWIPPVPIMSKKSEDYDMFVSGILPMETETLPDGAVKEVLDAMNEELDGTELIKECDVESSVTFAKFIEDELEDGSYRRYNYNDNTVQNLAALNNVFRSWYKPDNKEQQELFRNAPENIRKRFLEQSAFNNPGLLDKIMHGEEIEEPLPDMNQMVNDPVTGRTMTRGEFEKRQVIRFLVSSGWNESRLLNYQKVGSELERRPRTRRTNKKRRRGPETMNEVSGMYGNFMNEPTGDIDPMYSENELLMDSLRQLMRGDAVE